MSTHLGSTNSTRAPRSGVAEVDSTRLAVDGIVSGLAGGIALAVPLLVWDWGHTAHRALELPMATTAWVFGLQHFSQERRFRLIAPCFLCQGEHDRQPHDTGRVAS